MSHPKELIAAIKAKLITDYPLGRYQYQTEKAIPGTRMFPDLTIRDITSGSIQCVVEIGYTRPEKLTAYRERLCIPDVRWYAKDGQLHPGWQECRVRAIVDIALSTPSQVFIYDLGESLTCPECWEEWVDEIPMDASTDQRCELMDQAFEETQSGHGVLITDLVKGFLPAHCDVCDFAWLAEDHEPSGGWNIMEGFRDAALRRYGNNLREFGLRFGARKQVTWVEASEIAREILGDDLSYLADGTFIHEGMPDPKEQLIALARIEVGADIAHVGQVASR